MWITTDHSDGWIDAMLPTAENLAALDDASDPETAIGDLVALARHRTADVRLAALQNPALRTADPAVLDTIRTILINEHCRPVFDWAFHAGLVPDDQIPEFVDFGTVAVHAVIAEHPGTDPHVLADLLDRETARLAANPLSPMRFDTEVVEALAANPAVGDQMIRALIDLRLGNVANVLAQRPDTPADRLADVRACLTNPQVLGRIVERPDCPADVLAALADKDVSTVRHAVWTHPNAPDHVRAYGLRHAATRDHAARTTSTDTLTQLIDNPDTVTAAIRPAMEELVQRGQVDRVVSYLERDNRTTRTNAAQALIAQADLLDLDTVHHLITHPGLTTRAQQVKLVRAVVARDGTEAVTAYLTSDDPRTRASVLAIITDALT